MVQLGGKRKFVSGAKINGSRVALNWFNSSAVLCVHFSLEFVADVPEAKPGKLKGLLEEFARKIFYSGKFI